MGTILPKIKTRYGEGVGVELFVAFPEIFNNEKTFFDANEAAAQTALSANGTNFSTSQYVVLGTPGIEKTEISLLHPSTTPTSTTITTAAAITFAHNRGDRITFIPYNQIVVERSTDDGDNFTPLSAVDIRPDASETYIQRTTDATSDVYRFRFFNSEDSTYSAYSDEVTGAGLADNTVGAIKKRALDDLGEEKNELITDEFLNQSLNTARRELDEDERVLRWSFRTSFNTDIGDIIPGRYSIAVPSDLRDPNTHKNILNLRIGRSNFPLTYQDNNRFIENYREVAHTTLNGAITDASLSIVLTSSGDFDESGAVDIAAEDITEEIDNVNYTTNTENTKTLGTVTNIDNSHATGRDVWQGLGFGEPRNYTIDNGMIYFDIPFENDLAGENIVMDYYKTLTAVDSDSDTLDEVEYDMFVNYLKWKIKYKKANGNLDPEKDGDFKEWDRKKERFISKENTGQFAYFVPDIPE